MQDLMELFDSHCHVDEEKFDEDRDDVLARMKENGITRYAVIGSDMATSEHAVEFARTHDGAVAAVGIHPHEAKGFRPEDTDRIRGWILDGQAAAIGEIGLDYYYDLSPRETQIEVCRLQMELAYDLGAPVAYHIRDAHQDMIDIMKDMKRYLTPGIIHCFSGSAEIAREYLKLGYHISFAGPLTFKKAPNLCRAAAEIPEDRLLIETDSPYLAPEPMRGRRNEPANVRFVARKLAEIRGETTEQVAAYTFENACRLYGIK
ncbi:MAG: TatD family hydrolase [Clostridia bacterium]|nr:TatD family hydrolase [Clostridia bacterium]